MKELRIGITGATGFLGSHTALALQDRGATVVGVVRNPSKGAWLEARGIEQRRADLFEPEALRSAFEGLDVVISNATLPGGPHIGSVPAFLDEARTTIRNVVDAALSAGVTRMVHISSASAYGGVTPWRTVQESDELRDTPARDLLASVTTRGYAASKAAGEKVAWEGVARGLRLTTLRPAPIYGPRDQKVTRMYEQALRGWLRPAPTLGMPHVYVGDVVAAIVGALDNPASVGRAYNVTGPPRSILALARAARKALGRGPWLIPVPVPVSFRFDNHGAQHDLGVRFRSPEEGMQQTFSAREPRGEERARG